MMVVVDEDEDGRERPALCRSWLWFYVVWVDVWLDIYILYMGNEDAGVM